MIFILLIGTISSVNIVSASWFDNALGKITGKVTENETSEEIKEAVTPGCEKIIEEQARQKCFDNTSWYYIFSKISSRLFH